MAYICQFVCSYRTPSGYCGSTGGYATCQHRKMDEPPTIKSAEPIKPLTNADKFFRNATDEEIADWLDQLLWGTNRDVPFAVGCTVEKWLDWLKQEVSDD